MGCLASEWLESAGGKGGWIRRALLSRHLFTPHGRSRCVLGWGLPCSVPRARYCNKQSDSSRIHPRRIRKQSVRSWTLLPRLLAMLCATAFPRREISYRPNCSSSFGINKTKVAGARPPKRLFRKHLQTTSTISAAFHVSCLAHVVSWTLPNRPLSASAQQLTVLH
jgi:hypothetical protein